MKGRHMFILSIKIIYIKTNKKVFYSLIAPIGITIIYPFIENISKGLPINFSAKIVIIIILVDIVLILLLFIYSSIKVIIDQHKSLAKLQHNDKKLPESSPLHLRNIESKGISFDILITSFATLEQQPNLHEFLKNIFISDPICSACKKTLLEPNFNWTYYDDPKGYHCPDCKSTFEITGDQLLEEAKTHVRNNFDELRNIYTSKMEFSSNKHSRCRGW